MGHKNALAGIWWGGGKGVIARRESSDHRDPDVRAAVYRDYGRFVSSLCGCYVTAEDVGTTPEDMAFVFSTTRYTTCIPLAFGGSGNPSILTATGVVIAMEAALEQLGLDTLEDKTVAMQGLGNVSFYMIEELLKRRVKKVVGTDIDLAAIQMVGDRFAGQPVDTRVVSPDDVSIFSESCDILAPNAVGATLNPQTIPLIQARIVCGAANNQLEDSPRDARLLKERDILYVPDFLANRMGIVNCSNEQYGIIEDDPAIEAHLDRDTEFGIFRRCLDVCSRAAGSGLSTAEEAEALADDLSDEPHPIWGDRGQQIIDHLVCTGWSEVDVSL
jgi:glutamate dehydrogenase/leucine dehydrogenase